MLNAGLELSPPVAAQVDKLVAKAVGELARCEERLTPRKD